MRCPTDTKFLWEGIEKAYVIMCTLSSRLNVHRPRTKYVDVEKANLSYRKQRRHTKVRTGRLTRRLLNLLILNETHRLERENTQTDSLLTVRQKSGIEIITRMYRRQKNHFENNDPRESVRDRIVSVSKPYVRPIVRDYEMKNVEFRARCNNIPVDRLPFIEKLSFNAFSEGTGLPHCLRMYRKLFGVDARNVGGDAGYSDSANREYCKERGIHTSFVKRGRPSLEKKKRTTSYATGWRE